MGKGEYSRHRLSPVLSRRPLWGWHLFNHDPGTLAYGRDTGEPAGERGVSTAVLGGLQRTGTVKLEPKAKL